MGTKGTPSACGCAIITITDRDDGEWIYERNQNNQAAGAFYRARAVSMGDFRLG